MHHVESMLHNPVPFGASGQSITDRFNAAKHSLAGSQLGKVVCKATTEEVMGPKKKHLDYLLHCTHEPNISIPQLANLLIERVQNEHWAVSLKALITLHNLMCYGNERFMQYLASCNAKFEMQQFSDAGTQAGVDMCAHVRNYGGYITEKIATYRMVAFDFCKVKRGRDDGLMRAMDAENLLKTMPILQGQIDALLTFKVTTGDLTNGVINSAFILLFRDLIRLFACYNDGIINLLEKYFDMNKKQCRTGLDMYKQFVKRMEVVAGFLNVAESVGIDRGEIPDLAQAPASLMRALVPVPDPVKVWDCSLEDHLATLEGRPTSKDKVKELEKDAKSFEKVERKEKEKKGGKPPPRPNAAPQRPPPPPAKSKLTPEGSDEEEDEDKEETESIREIPRVKKTAGKKAAAAPPPRPSYTPQPPTDDEQEEEEQPDEPVHAPIQTQPMHSFNPFATADDDQPAARSPSPPRSPSHSGTPPPSPPVPRQTRRSKSPAVPARPVRPSPQRHAAEAPKRPAAPAKKAPPMPAVQPDLIDDLLGLGDDWTPPPGSSPAPTAATVVHDSQEEDEEEEEEEDVQPVNMQQNGVPNIFEAYQPSESYGEPEHVVDVLETSDEEVDRALHGALPIADGSPGGAGFNPFLAEADDSTPVPPTTINPFADYQQPASKPKAKSKSRPPLPTYDVSDSEEHEQEPEQDAALFNPFASLTSNPTNNSGGAAAHRSMLLVASRSPSPPTPTPVLTGGMEAPDLANPFFAAAAAAQDKADKLSKGTKKGKPARPPPASAGPPNIYDQTPFCGIDLRTEDSRSPSLTRHDGRAPSRPPAPHRDSVASSGVGPPSRPPPPGSSGRASRASGTGTDSPMVARAHSPPQQKPKPPVTAGGKKKTKAKTQKPADDFGDFDPFSSILNAAAQPQQPPPQTFVSSKPKPKQKVITNDLETSLMSLCDNLDFTMKDKKGAAKPVQPGRTAQPEVLNSKMTAPTTIADNEQSLL